MTEDERVLARLAGGILFVVGVLWMVLSGGCTVVFLGGLVAGAFLHPDLVQEGGPILVVLLTGTIGILPGVGLFFLGRWIRMRTQPAKT